MAEPALPGIIINAGDQPVGVLSRQRLLAALSQPFGREVFIKRPVHELIKSIDISPLILPAETPIATASKYAMSRSDPVRYEPLLVRHENFVGLLDVPDLLTAQATLLEVTLKSKDDLIRQIQRTAEQLSAAREVAQREATHDALTGLPNRKLFLDILEASMAGKRAGMLQDCAVMFIDLDRFKPVNDSLGHPAGDAVLQEAAARLGRIVRRRPAHTVSGLPLLRDTVARLSGDEFAVLLVNISGASTEAEIAQRLLADLARPFKILGVTVHLSASIGILASIDHYDFDRGNSARRRYRDVPGQAAGQGARRNIRAVNARAGRAAAAY